MTSFFSPLKFFIVSIILMAEWPLNERKRYMKPSSTIIFNELFAFWSTLITTTPTKFITFFEHRMLC